MIAKSLKDLEGMRAAGKAIAEIRDFVQEQVQAGMATRELDRMAGEKMQQMQVRSAPKELYHFPGNVCISVNDCVAHGIPSEYILQEGDILNIDVSGSLNGYYGDTGISLVIGNHAEKQKLVDCSKAMFDVGKEFLVPKGYLRDMGRRMQECAESRGFQVVEKLCGHGIGKTLHDNPHNIYCHDLKWDSRRFREHMTVAIETFVAAGSGEAYVQDDHWSWVTADGSPTAQYEHTVLITKQGPEILT